MNSSIALRLLWKEYRIQRGLWLSMAIGCFLLQSIVAYLMHSSQEAFQGIVPIAFMLTFFYAIGSGAITFAIEREDGTQLRPVMLGCPPALTLTVKTLFGVITTALLLAITIGSGMLMSLGSLTLPEGTFPPEVSSMIIPLGLLFVGLPYLGALLWSTFFSLLTRKVIVALGLAAVAMLLSYAFVAAFSFGIAGTSRSGELNQPASGLQIVLLALLPCFLALLVFAFNYLLTHRWLTRVFFDQSSAKKPSLFRRWRIRRSGLDGGMIVEIGVEDRTAFEVVSPEVAEHMPPPRFGLSLLYGTWGPNLWRHLRFLRWKEAIETRKVFVGFLLATLFLTGWCVGENPNTNGAFGIVGFFIHAACVACGAMSYRAEQDERKIQRLADMGLRPATVWFSKHLVWFVRAIISIAAILMFMMAPWWLHLYGSSHGRPGIETFVNGVWLNLPHPNNASNDLLGVRLVGRAIILMLLMYGIGQVCSQLIRSTIVSFFVAFLLALAGFGWAGACYWFDVPFTLSVLPLAIGCLLLTWLRMNSWMKDDNRGRTWLWPATSMAMVIAVTYCVTGLFRVYQIPWSEPFFSDTGSGTVNDGLTSDQRAAVLAPVTIDERNTYTLYQRASDRLGGTRVDQRSGEKTVAELWEALSEEEQSAVENGISLVLKSAGFPACADFSPTNTNVVDTVTATNIGPYHDAVDLLLFDARRKIESGELEVALDRYEAAFNVSRHAAGRGVEMNWWASHHTTQETLRALQKWAEHPDVDSTLTTNAAAIIDAHREQMLPLEVTNFATAVVIRNTLDADAFAIAELTDGSSNRLPIMLSTKFPGERTRSLRLLNALEAQDLELLASYQAQKVAGRTQSRKRLVQRYNSIRRQRGTERELGSAVTSTPLLAMISSVSADYLIRTDIKMERQVRATKLLMQLLVEQRASKQLPVTLDDFDKSLHDPWTGQPFIWHPEGLPGDLKRGSMVVVKANTPFFLSTGHAQATIRRVEYGGSDEASGASETGQADEQPVVVEYILDGITSHSSSDDVAVWKLPKAAATSVSEKQE